MQRNLLYIADEAALANRLFSTLEKLSPSKPPGIIQTSNMVEILGKITLAGWTVGPDHIKYPESPAGLYNHQGKLIAQFSKKAFTRLKAGIPQPSKVKQPSKLLRTTKPHKRPVGASRAHVGIDC